MSATLSVVVPVHDERPEDLATTLAALGRGLHDASWRDPEVIIVDDGSVTPVQIGDVPGARTRVLRQINRGRFEARCTGIKAACGDYVLLLDARVTLDPQGVAWVAEQVGDTPSAWNGHCLMANPDSPFARFWNVLTHSAFADYLDDPRTTSFTLDEYDRYPKGTGHFLAPRSWLLEAIAEFNSRYADSRFSSDDTHLLRAIVARDRIHISPQFASVYRNREALVPFLRHAVHRGTTFYDGFARPGTRWAPVVAAAFPATAIAIGLAVRRPVAAAGAAVTMSGCAAGFAAQRRRPVPEVVAFGALVVPFSAAFAAGLWRGAGLAAAARLRA